MLFKTRRNSGSLHRVIGGGISALPGSLVGLLVVYKIPYASCILIQQLYLSQARWCVPIILLSIWYTVVACVIFTHGFSRCRGYWIWVFCCLFVVRIYMFGWLCRATCCSVVFTPMVYHMLSKTTRSSGSLHRVINEVLVLGLPVVCKIPYSSCMFNTAVVLEPAKM